MMEKGNFIFTKTPPANPGTWVITPGDALDVLWSVKNDICVDSWVTSPPYFNILSYGTDGDFGMIQTVRDYIAAMQEVAAAMLEVSSHDATLFWVIKDTFNGSGGLSKDFGEAGKAKAIRPPVQKTAPRKAQLLIPERTRIAIADVGWVPKLSIIWDKQDARRGARDRPSYSYEHILVFSASPDPYWDREAVLTPYASASKGQLTHAYTGQSQLDYSQLGQEDPSDTKRRMVASMANREGAYLKSVWNIPSGSQPVVDGEKSLASFPLLLPEICVNLGCRPGGLVGDPFAGFGTSILAAAMWGRNAFGIELNPHFVKLAEKRIEEEL